MKNKQTGCIGRIVRKELYRFLTDRRMVISILLPGVLIYVLYSFIGSAITSSFSGDENATYRISVTEMPESLTPLFEGLRYEDGETPVFILQNAGDNPDSSMTAVRNGTVDLYMVFPAGFDAAVAAYRTGEGTAPQVEVYYSSTENNSAAAYSVATGLLGEYESSLSNKFDLNRNADTVYDLADERDVTGKIFSSMMPMLLIIFLFSGCMSTAPESIAGEKERGTIATLLITPMRRSDLAIGKVIGITVISILSGLSSFVGVMLALPKLMGSAGAISGSVYSTVDYLMILAVMLSTVFLFVSVISVLSAYAKSVKEATTLIMPLMVLEMLIGVTGMFGDGAPTQVGWYLLPIYNSVQSLAAIFSFTATAPMIGTTLAVNLGVSAALAFLLTKMFDSEKMMFNR